MKQNDYNFIERNVNSVNNPKQIQAIENMIDLFEVKWNLKNNNSYETTKLKELLENKKLELNIE